MYWGQPKLVRRTEPPRMLVLWMLLPWRQVKLKGWRLKGLLSTRRRKPKA